MKPRTRAPARARVRRPTPGVMNKTEQAYRDLLQDKLQRGEIEWFAYEPAKLRLADRTYYTPDFLVINADLEVELHEVKGFWQDDARVKIKVAAHQFPHFKFLAATPRAKKLGGGWDYEEFAA